MPLTTDPLDVLDEVYGDLASTTRRGDAILNLLPLPVLQVDGRNMIVDANVAAEALSLIHI